MRAVAVVLVASALAGCSGSATPEPRSAAAADEPLPPARHELQLPEAVRAHLDDAFTGDLDLMVKRRMIRVGVAYNRTHYFVDKGEQRGAAYEHLKLFGEQLDAAHRTGNLEVLLVFIPLPRAALLPALTGGKVDLVAAQLTVTPERAEVVDFTVPTRNDVREVAVSGAGGPPLATAEALSGRRVFVRKTSSYHQSLLDLNQALVTLGKPPVEIELAPEELEDDDILEMVHAGLVPITIVDDYLAHFWKQVLPGLRVHDGAAVRTGARLAVAVRKGNPKLKAAASAFIAKHGEGSAFRNVIEKRYLQSTAFVKDAASEEERQKFRAQVELFRKYGKKYDLDFLLMAAQGYQESRLDQQARGRTGAIGVMQVMPATGREMDVGDIRQLEPNIHAGVKYVRFMMDRYWADESMDRLNKGLFTFAAYNAGPGRIRQLRAEAARRGLDSNVWFGNVERVASERIGRETVTYVSNIYKYYVAYRLVLAEMERRAAAKQAR